MHAKSDIVQPERDGSDAQASEGKEVPVDADQGRASTRTHAASLQAAGHFLDLLRVQLDSPVLLFDLLPLRVQKSRQVHLQH